MDAVENAYTGNDKEEKKTDCCEDLAKDIQNTCFFFLIIYLIVIILRLTIIVISFIYSLNLIFIIFNILSFILTIINGVLSCLAAGDKEEKIFRFILISIIIIYIIDLICYFTYFYLHFNKIVILLFMILSDISITPFLFCCLLCNKVI